MKSKVLKIIVIIVVVMYICSCNISSYENLSELEIKERIKKVDSIKSDFVKDCNVETTEIVFSR